MLIGFKKLHFLIQNGKSMLKSYAYELFHVPWNECILEINFEELFPARRFAQIAK